MLNLPIKNLDTPSLLLDLTVLKRNLLTMKQVAEANNVNWRPHIKTHKCMKIAKMQLELGACGVTVAKLDEAEMMVNAGVKDILIAYPLSSSQKLTRLVSLSKKAQITVAIDSIEQAWLVNQAFDEIKPITVWIKVNSGLNRCGVELDEVLQLATEIKKMQNIHLNGVFTHAGQSYSATSKEALQEISIHEANVVLKSASICESIGIPISHRSIGSTPTFKYGATVKGITEIRPGNAAFYDMCQVGLGVAALADCALSVLSSVVSVKKDRIIFDAGSKALSLDQGAHGSKTVTGYGKVVQHDEITIARLSEEHGVATFSEQSSLQLTDKVQIIPNHSCVVANLFNEYYIYEDGVVIDIWPVDARGKMK